MYLFVRDHLYENPSVRLCVRQKEKVVQQYIKKSLKKHTQTQTITCKITKRDQNKSMKDSTKE